MSKDNIPSPHATTELVDRTIPEVEREHFMEIALKRKAYTISNADLSVFYRIADGTLSPLEGPMGKDEFYKVLDEEVILYNGKKFAWTIPLAFPISKKESETFTIGETISVKNEHGVLVGALEISDIYYFEKDKYNKSVYGTERKDHPGPRIVNSDQREYLMGGKIWALPQRKSSLFGKYMLSPAETRVLFKERKWERIIAFQTRNPLHRAHEYAMVYGLEKLSKEGFYSGCVLNPLVGETKSDDTPADIRMKTYEVLIEGKLIGDGDKDKVFWEGKGYDLNDNMTLIGLDMKMFYAGPKEAIMHAIYRQNCGFTDIIIGRKHADAPFDDGTPVWGDFDAQEKFSGLKGELLIRPVKVGFAAYFEELGRVGLVEEYKNKGYHQVTIKGSDLRKRLETREKIDERIMRKPVAEILSGFYQTEISRREQRIKSKNIVWQDMLITKTERELSIGHKAAVVWLTGLPSSGKSTIAAELESILFRRGCNIYILDGDNVRHGLNKDLGFSPADRVENIRRVAEAAKLFADAGFLIIVSFISPYKKDREAARALLPKGNFIEVYVKADISVCEKRDIKGMYKKARSGQIKDFTGVSAPYEEPQNPEIVIDTENETKEESARFIVGYLEENGYIPKKIFS